MSEEISGNFYQKSKALKNEVLNEFSSNDEGKNLFEAFEALFSPTKLVILKCKDASEVTKNVIKYRNNLYVLRHIPTPNFIVLHSLFVDYLVDALKTNPKRDKDYCLISDFILSMSVKHLDFSTACLQVLYLPTSNTDVERGFSAYNKIVSDRRCRILEGNAEDFYVACYPDRQQKSHITFKRLADSFCSFGTVKQTRVKHKFHPYRMSLHQDLYGNDFLKRVNFCNWIRKKMRSDVSCLSHVLFSDEANFAYTGNVNRHNMHYWANENPQWMRTVPFQYPWSVNCWRGIVGDNVIGLYFFEGRLTGQVYLT